MKIRFLKLFGIIIFMFGMIASAVYHTGDNGINWVDFVIGAITGAGLGMALGMLKRAD